MLAEPFPDDTPLCQTCGHFLAQRTIRFDSTVHRLDWYCLNCEPSDG